MFCRYCGRDIPADSVFCSSCGSSLATVPANAITKPIFNEPPPPSPTAPKSRNTGKKALATALIVLFSFMLLGENAEASKIPKDADLAYLLGQLFGIALVITGLILSIRWQVKLAGYVQTSGRQAAAIFLIVFCSWGLLLVFVFGAMEIEEKASWLLTLPIVMGLAYASGLYTCIRWLKKLRRSEQTGSDTLLSTSTAN